MEHIIFPFIQDFFIKLGISTTAITMEQIGDNLNIKVDTPDSALLIGIHGKSIEAFQHLLSRMIERKTNSFIHVHLEVNDYMKQKDEKLFRFLDSKITLIRSTGQPIPMTSLTPYERKKAHGYIADKNIIGLKTQSEGEGSSRSLILSYTGELTSSGSVHSHKAPSEKKESPVNNLSDDGIGI